MIFSKNHNIFISLYHLIYSDLINELLIQIYLFFIFILILNMINFILNDN